MSVCGHMNTSMNACGPYMISRYGHPIDPISPSMQISSIMVRQAALSTCPFQLATVAPYIDLYTAREKTCKY